MVQATACLEGGTLSMRAPGLPETARRCGEGDLRRLRELSEEYRGLCGRKEAAERLLNLGRRLYSWLDGDTRWLDGLLGRVQGPWRLAFQASPWPDDVERTFLEAPWEILAAPEGAATGPKGFLAADTASLYCPVRRLGEAGDSPPPGRHCLGLVFMAGAPRGADSLDHGAEENALLEAVGRLPVDLEVEESGNPEWLQETLVRLAEYAPMQVLHLSGHGHSDPEPVLLLEDALGGERPTGASGLEDLLPPDRPRLVFLSACSTARSGSVSGSLALALVRAGTPAVLGWEGPVGDAEATAFARQLYHHLALRKPLEESTARARRDLLGSERASRDWHLARLWLGPAGGGPLVGGTVRRRMLDPEHGHKAFLDRRNRRPVASRKAFVGRRRDLQAALRFVREGGHAGLLLHGQGRVGKSSLAARILHRSSDLMPVVVYGDEPGEYGALDLARELSACVPEAGPLVKGRLEDLRRDPGAMEDLLRQVLEGPCQQVGAGRPVLLVLDDLEKILDPPAGPGQAWRVKTSHVPVLGAVLRAFHRARTDSRLLVTSRYAFTLPDARGDLANLLLALPLGPMDAVGARLLPRRRGLGPGDPLVERAVKASSGNPGLQDLLLDEVSADAEATPALEGMEAWLEGGRLPEEGGEARAFLEDLDLESLLEMVGPGGRDLLRQATVFEVPVPGEVLAELAESGGQDDVERLLGLGLLDRFEDLVEPTRRALAVNALVRPLVGRLRESEERSLAGKVLPRLIEAWGGEDRPHDAHLELFRLALRAEDTKVLAATGEDALSALSRRDRHRDRSDWALEALKVLESSGMEPGFGFLREAAKALQFAGHIQKAADLLRRASEELDARGLRGEEVGPLEEGALLVDHALLLVQTGHPAEAEPLLEAALDLAFKAGDLRDWAVALGHLARLKAARGEVDEALRIHREGLVIFEALGAKRDRAATLGDVAQLKGARGEVDEALRLHQEQLEIYDSPGDKMERAGTLGYLARLKAARCETDDALRLHKEQLEIYESLGAVRERAITLGDLARLKVAQRDMDGALHLYQEALRISGSLGALRDEAVTLADLARLRAARGEVDEALRLHQEGLEVFNSLGDVEGQANALWELSRLDLHRDNVGDALSKMSEAYRMVQRLERLDAICFIGARLGQLLYDHDRKDEGLTILRRSQEGFLQLGRPADAEKVAEALRQLEPS